MGLKYVTRHDSMTQATNTFAAVDTASDGTSPGRIGTSGYRRIRQIISTVTIDGAHSIDTGNAFVVRLTGTGLVHDSQEILVGGLMAQDQGAASTASYMASRPATSKYVDIPLKSGDIFLTAAFNGTDPGTPFVSITLGLEK